MHSKNKCGGNPSYEKQGNTYRQNVFWHYYFPLIYTFTNYRASQNTLQAAWSKCLSLKGTKGPIKTEHLTNLKNRSILGLCFGTEDKTASLVFIIPLTLKRGVIRECCESAWPFGYK